MALRPSTATPYTARQSICGHNTSTPDPFKKIPRTISMKYRTGFRYVSHCTAGGMLRIGKAKPLNMNAGVEKKNDDIMACCCVCEMVDRNSPAPRVVIRNKTEHAI